MNKLSDAEIVKRAKKQRKRLEKLAARFSNSPRDLDELKPSIRQQIARTESAISRRPHLIGKLRDVVNDLEDLL